MLDIFGRPGRRFYEFLQKVATDEKEKEEIGYLLSKEGKQDYLKLVQETVTYFDLFEKWPSTVPSLDYIC